MHPFCEAASYIHRPAKSTNQMSEFGTEYRRKHGSKCRGVETIASEGSGVGGRAQRVCNSSDSIEFIVRSRRLS